MNAYVVLKTRCQRLAKPLLGLLAAALLTFNTQAGPDGASSAADTVSELQRDWAVANYQTEGKARQAAFDSLLGAVAVAQQSHKDDAGVLIWSGIIHSSYAGVKGGLGALKFAKMARAELEQALALDPEALHGSAYTSLGTLYYKVPGWPIGFGNKDKAAELLQRALALNPDGIDPNYFYGEYLLEQGALAQAKTALLHAQAAPPRPGREVADQGRQAEIAALLQQIAAKLGQ
jgi:tetratricopeptide (TPR) repeat protein